MWQTGMVAGHAHGSVTHSASDCDAVVNNVQKLQMIDGSLQRYSTNNNSYLLGDIY